jgi:hypothetical protein
VRGRRKQLSTNSKNWLFIYLSRDQTVREPYGIPVRQLLGGIDALFSRNSRSRRVAPSAVAAVLA